MWNRVLDTVFRKREVDEYEKTVYDFNHKKRKKNTSEKLADSIYFILMTALVITIVIKIIEVSI